MKISNNSLLSLCLAFLALTLTQSFSQGNTFPESWDETRTLRNTSGEVLIWKHSKRLNSDFSYKTCITLVVGEDSLGNSIYYISENYSNKEPFSKWNYASIHFAPKDGELFGFHDLHLESFKTKPTSEEITALLERWMFHLQEEDYITIESGIDEALWMKYFGFVWDDQEQKRD